MPAKKKQEIVVKVYNTYYRTKESFGDITEEYLFELFPVAETKVFVNLEKNDDFNSIIDGMLTVDNCIPSSVEEKCDVLYTIMSFDNEVVYKSIQKIGLFCGE